MKSLSERIGPSKIRELSIESEVYWEEILESQVWVIDKVPILSDYNGRFTGMMMKRARCITWQEPLIQGHDGPNWRHFRWR